MNNAVEISKKWKDDLYLNDNILFLFNREIYEYDMRDGGLSLTREFKLLPQKEIDRLLSYGNARVEGGKKKHSVEEGKLQRNNDKYKNELKEAFKNARKLFFEANNLEDTDILSVKKDAIFVTKMCRTQKFGKYIDFRPKNCFTSYVRLGKKLEIYYCPEKIVVKGISDDILKYHDKYILKFLKLYFHKMETCSNVEVIQFMKRFIDKYKRKELELGYYRNFNQKSDFSVIGDNDNEYMEYWEEDKDDLDISYNYFNVLIKLIKIPL